MRRALLSLPPAKRRGGSASIAKAMRAGVGGAFSELPPTSDPSPPRASARRGRGVERCTILKRALTLIISKSTVPNCSRKQTRRATPASTQQCAISQRIVRDQPENFVASKAERHGSRDAGHHCEV